MLIDVCTSLHDWVCGMAVRKIMRDALADGGWGQEVVDAARRDFDQLRVRMLLQSLDRESEAVQAQFEFRHGILLR